MTGYTVGNYLKHCRAFSGKEKLFFACGGVDDSERVVSVDAFSVHLVRIEAGADACGVTEAHCFSGCLTAHSVEIVKYVKENRHSLVGIFSVHAPKLRYLIHRSKVKRFEHRTATERAISGVCDYDSGLVVASLVESRAESYGSCAAYDSIIRENTERNEKCVHRAAETAVETCSTCKDLRESAVEQEVDRQLLYISGVILLSFNDLKH